MSSLTQSRPAAGVAAVRRPTSRRILGRIGLYVLVIACAVIMLFPFLWTLATSLTSDGDLANGPTLLVHDPTLASYSTLVSAVPIWRIIINSLVIAVVATLLQLLTGSMAAYGFSRLQFKGKGVIFALYLATLMVPLEVLVVPLFVEMKKIGLQDSYFALLAPSIASAFGIFLVKQAMDAVPRELDEAATIDGGNHLRIYATIMLPLVRPALATLAVFAFMGSWNSFLWPLVVIHTPEHMTLPLGLSTLQGQYTTQWNVVMAGSVVSIIPIAIIYLLAQRHIITGIAYTGIK